jgi:hypothetical protein
MLLVDLASWVDHPKRFAGNIPLFLVTRHQLTEKPDACH